MCNALKYVDVYSHVMIHYINDFFNFGDNRGENNERIIAGPISVLNINSHCSVFGKITFTFSIRHMLESFFRLMFSK